MFSTLLDRLKFIILSAPMFTTSVRNIERQAVHLRQLRLRTGSLHTV